MSISFSFKHCEILKYFNENVNKCFFYYFKLYDFIFNKYKILLLFVNI